MPYWDVGKGTTKQSYDAGRTGDHRSKAPPGEKGGPGYVPPPKKKYTAPPGEKGGPGYVPPPKKKTVTPPPFKDSQFLHNLKLKSIAARNRGITNTNNFRNMLLNLFFSPAGAAELDLSGYTEQEKKDILAAAGKDTTTTTDLGPRPNVNDPFISSKIAEAAGLTTTPQRIGQKEVFGKKIPGTGDLLNMPTALSLDAIKQIQIDKRDNLMSLEDAQQKASDIGYPTVLTPEQTKTIYDMVRLQQPDQRALVANGGLINLFKYGGFI